MVDKSIPHSGKYTRTYLQGEVLSIAVQEYTLRQVVRNLSSQVRLSMCTYCMYGYLDARTAHIVFSDVHFCTYTYSFLLRTVFTVEEP